MLLCTTTKNWWLVRGLIEELTCKPANHKMAELVTFLEKNNAIEFWKIKKEKNELSIINFKFWKFDNSLPKIYQNII